MTEQNREQEPRGAKKQREHKARSRSRSPAGAGARGPKKQREHKAEPEQKKSKQSVRRRRIEMAPYIDELEVLLINVL